MCSVINTQWNSISSGGVEREGGKKRGREGGREGGRGREGRREGEPRVWEEGGRGRVSEHSRPIKKEERPRERERER